MERKIVPQARRFYWLTVEPRIRFRTTPIIIQEGISISHNKPEETEIQTIVNKLLNKINREIRRASISRKWGAPTKIVVTLVIGIVVLVSMIARNKNRDIKVTSLKIMLAKVAAKVPISS